MLFPDCPCSMPPASSGRAPRDGPTTARTDPRGAPGFDASRLEEPAQIWVAIRGVRSRITIVIAMVGLVPWVGMSESFSRKVVSIIVWFGCL